jgi:hypothetical protein
MSFSIKPYKALVSQQETEIAEETKESKESKESKETKETEETDKTPIIIQRGSNHGISIQNTSSSVDDY